jgi:hypothetical protein
MIITKLQGGLGNQLFQWAYGKALAAKNGTNLFLDTSFYYNQTGNTHRNYELTKFPNLICKNPEIEDKKTIIIGDNFQYNEFIYNENYHYYLNGFWQSEKYFLNASDLIRKQLQPTTEIIEKLKQQINGKSVSLHVRRTDYVTSNGFHPVQTLEYYNKALEIIGNHDQLLVFSDDINWCKENLKYENILFIENQDNVEDLWLMSLCDHNIIANSSFSWWGAWLNKNKNKIVIAPNNWFGVQTNLNNLDIIPANWVKYEPQ